MAVPKKYTRRQLLIRAGGILLTGTLLATVGCSDSPGPTGTPVTPTPGETPMPAPPTPTASPAPTSTPVRLPTPTVEVFVPTPTPPFPVNRVEFRVNQYISRQTQLEPMFNDPAQSFYLQPWRGFLETKPADQLLAGLGINYNLPGDTDDAVALETLAASGFRAIRLEISWNRVTWEEDGFTGQDRLNTILGLCKKLNLAPLILLNANQGAPCPSQSYKKTVVSGGSKGSRALTLNSLSDLTAGYSGLSTDGWMAEILFTDFDQTTNTVKLSKPLPMDIATGTQVDVYRLKYLPLYAVGTPQFEETAKGWLKYVQLVMELVRRNGITNYELEIWNELTFGSEYLTINNYYDPPLFKQEIDPLRQDGDSWTLGKRTVDFIRQTDPNVRSVWGFSNTTFFHTPIKELPAGTGGQSYHPYGTQLQIIPKDFPPKDRYDWFIEKYIPQNLTWCMPEGWAHLGTKTETLMKLLNPVSRKSDLPPETASFAHYMTEHGFIPSEAGIEDKQVALQHKAKSLIRATLFWLNKGLSRMYIFAAYQDNDTAQGMLAEQPTPADYGVYSAEDLLARSPALKSLRNLTGVFIPNQPLTEQQTRQLEIEVSTLDSEAKVFEGDASHPPLYYQDMIAVLPFQATANRFIVAYYVMSYDITKPLPATSVRLTVKNLEGTPQKVLLFDPIINRYFLSQKLELADGSVTLDAPAKDYPLLVIIE